MREVRGGDRSQCVRQQRCRDGEDRPEDDRGDERADHVEEEEAVGIVDAKQADEREIGAMMAGLRSLHASEFGGKADSPANPS